MPISPPVRSTAVNGVTIRGIRLVGVSVDTGEKLLFTLCFIAILWLLLKVLRALVHWVQYGRVSEQTRFWTRQAINLFFAVLLIIGLLSIWFNDPTRLATAIGLVSAGVAFALQRVITSFAGYIVILPGNTFTVGDRISMGGVRGDVIALGFIQKTLMEMGEPPSVTAVARRRVSINTASSLRLSPTSHAEHHQ